MKTRPAIVDLKLLLVKIVRKWGQPAHWRTLFALAQELGWTGRISTFRSNVRFCLKAYGHGIYGI
jgi:hypothetical protein